VISRYLVIALAMVVAGLQVSRGAYVEAVGLGGLAAGLIILRVAGRESPARRYAWAAFLVTAVSVGIVLVRSLR
jgi:hypothetical protein